MWVCVCSQLSHACGKLTFRQRGQQQQIHNGRATPMPKQRHRLRVAIEGGDVLVEPQQRLGDVHDGVAAGGGVVLCAQET